MKKAISRWPHYIYNPSMLNFPSSPPGRPVAFTAKLRTDDSHQKHDGLLKFANVSLNQGGSYDPDTGMFTCPAAGLYHLVVSVTLCMDTDSVRGCRSCCLK